MNNAQINFERPHNEHTMDYAPGCEERKVLSQTLDELTSEVQDIPLIIGGKEVRTGNTGTVVMPHNHQHVLANYHQASPKEVNMAIDAALKAHKEWETFPWVERASISLKVAELLATKYRPLINAATRL